MRVGWRHCVALTRRGRRVRNVFMKLSPDGTVPPTRAISTVHS
jgi:hypothetical protein